MNPACMYPDLSVAGRWGYETPVPTVNTKVNVVPRYLAAAPTG